MVATGLIRKMNVLVWSKLDCVKRLFPVTAAKHMIKRKSNVIVDTLKVAGCTGGDLSEHDEKPCPCSRLDVPSKSNLNHQNVRKLRLRNLLTYRFQKWLWMINAAL